jgi:hypothetical protein
LSSIAKFFSLSMKNNSNSSRVAVYFNHLSIVFQSLSEVKPALYMPALQRI